MAMTPEERKAARREASRRWYEKQKALGAKNPAAGKGGKPAAAKVKAVPARKAKAPAKKAPDAGEFEKRFAKLAAKNAKAVGQVKALVKEAGALAGEAIKALGQEKADAVAKWLKRGLSLSLSADFAEGKASVAFSADKQFRVPKAKAAAAALPEPEPEKPVEVAVDPAVLEQAEEGKALREEDVVPPPEAGCGEPDEWADPEDEGEDEEVDPDEMDDEEREEWEAEEAEREAEREREGRADMFRELESQGGFDGFED